MRLLLIAIALAVSCQSPASTAAPERAGLSQQSLSRVRELLEKLVAEKKIAGGVALVARRGQTAFLEAVGFRDVASARAMEPDTIFRICSMTKPVTSLAIMMLHEEKRLALSDPVSKFIPEFARPKVAVKRGDKHEFVDAEREITIRHLLTHTSGLTYGFVNREPLSTLYRERRVSDGLVETEGTIEENCRRLASVPLAFHPGTRWEYGLSTDVLGRVVEAASGMTLDEFFRRRIFEPLGMKDTGFIVPPARRGRVATVYRPRADKTIEPQPEGPQPLGPSAYSSTYCFSGRYSSGGAGLVSTARDYARFLQMLLNAGELDGARIVRKETVAEMTRDQGGGLKLGYDTHGDAFGYGFGVVTEKARDKGLGSPGTFSWGGFYHTYFFADPAEELIGIVLTQLYPWGHMGLWKDFRLRVYEALVR